ncbi:MAG: glutamate formimidoyltransferase [Candidatus Sericytochromatia bacterium]
MSKKLIECVPNFSEGRDLNIIKQITDQIESVEGTKLLDVDAGNATNRTVVTFVGEPEQVVEAAFRAIKKASELIDMSVHSGEHPRMGATDVCPFIPVANVSIEEAIEYSKKLAKKVGEELDIPVFLYEYSATKEDRRNLATIRAGEYEGLEKKLQDPNWKPDYGSGKFNAKAGGTVIGVRDFLIAYNVNLNTKSVKKANSVAFDIREQGRVKRIGDPINGQIVRDEQGNAIRVAGSLKNVKAIGWFIKEYDIAQISINLTNYKVTPLHVLFEETVKKATERGLRVTGSELVGMLPLEVMIETGKFYLKQQGRSAGVSEKELVDIAIKSLGLNELYKFEPEKKIIEYALRDKTQQPLINMDLIAFADETASESPAPGGGSISAYVGSLGVALASMVANVSANKKGWEDKIPFMSEYAEKAQILKDKLLNKVDEDTQAFNKIMEAFALPKNNDTEKKLRTESIQSATKNAILVPFQVMELCYESMELIKTMAEKGNPNSVTDAGVGALCARTGVLGAYLNVKINCKSFDDKIFVENILQKADEIFNLTKKAEDEILEIVNNLM